MKRIVVASLLPHAGHLTPSLRIAAALAHGDCEVVVVAPEEARSLMGRAPSGYAFESLGTVMPADSSAQLSRWASASPFERSLYVDRALEKHYLLPLSRNGFRLLPRLMDVVSSLDPELLIADDHLFRPAYERLARRTDKPMLLHRANGSQHDSQPRRHVPWRPDTISSRIATQLSPVASAIVNRWHRARHPGWHADYRAMLQELRSYWSETNEADLEHQVFHISCGQGALEFALLEDAIVTAPDVTQFGPLPSFPWQSDGSAVTDWIESDNRPVLVAGFGTMAPTEQFPINRLVSAGADAGYRTLFASRTEAPISSSLRDSFFWSPWMDQPAVLRHSRVNVFVSHAGSGAVQDALWAGVPMICHPFDWDQPYNAWVVEQIGLGLWPKSEQIFSSDLAALLIQAALLRERASDLRDQTVACDAAAQLRAEVGARWGLL